MAMEGRVEILLLGPLQASFAGRPIGLGPRKQRLLFAVLALEVNAHVSADRLMELLWPAVEPPPSARGMIHTYVSDLRKQILTAGLRDRGIWLDRQEAGYRLKCEPECIDVHRFESLVAAARQSDDDHDRVLKLSEALSLWRGPALAGITTEDIRARLCSRLQEAHITAIEERVAALMRLGRHDGLIGSLLSLTAEHPMRPRLIGALMQELQRSGRTTEALEIYRDIQQRMRNEFGLDPPAPLKELQLALLRNQPVVAAVATTPNSMPPLPRQLPADVPTFTGRTDEVDRLLASPPNGPGRPQAVVISIVDGMPGIGKTALVVHVGHRLAAQFPNGQLFLDLHGFTVGVAPVQPPEALDRLLRDVGVPGERIPGGLDERAALWRSLLAGRRMLIVLDNAATEAQVQPLLPGSAGCLVLVTSRRRLAALEASHTVSLDALPHTDAVRLFVHTADRPDLMAGTPGSEAELAEVVKLCGRLPLAIRIAAARLRHRRVWTLADLAQRLRGLDARLDALDDGQRSVHATLHLSYQQLSADVKQLNRLLGLHPGPEIEPYMAAALTDSSLVEVQRWLDSLVDDHLLAEPVPGRYRFHDLVRAHAATTSASEETPSQQRAAVDRLLEHYRHTAAAAMDLAYPYGRQRRPTVPPAGTPTPILADRNQADRWLDTELDNLLAAAHHAAKHGRPEHTWHLSAILDRHLYTRGRYRDAQTLHQQALDLACHLGNRAAEMHALNSLGYIQWRLGELEQAGDDFGRALQIAHAIGDRNGELQALTGLGDVHWMLNRHERANDHYGLVLQIAQAIGDLVGEMNALHGLGSVHWMLGRYERASDHFGQALQIAQAIGDRSGEMNALNGLGSVHWMLGDYVQAGDHHRQALQLARVTGIRVLEMQALKGLGQAERMLGRYSEAADCYQQVLALAGEVHSSNWQYEALQAIGRLHHATGQPDLALTSHEQALQYATDLTQPADQARAHDGLAHAYHTKGQHEQARQHWQHALNILTSLGTDHTEDIEASVPNIRAHLAKTMPSD